MNIGKPQSMKLAPIKVAKAVIPDVEDVEDIIDVPKPERKTVQGPDLTVRVPGNPNNEPVLPFGHRGFFFGG